jgi:hypothetical protein
LAPIEGILFESNTAHTPNHQRLFLDAGGLFSKNVSPF